MSKYLYLTNGMKVLVDVWWFDYLNQFSWGYTKKGKTGYAVRYKNRKPIYMHKLILKTNKLIDHVNRNGLDNRSDNLRVSNKSTNAMNTGIRKDNTSGYKGVYKSKENRKKRFQAYISANKKRIRLGWFATAKEAAKAYNTAALKYHGEFACLNIL